MHSGDVPTLVIGLTGKAGSGKSTVAQIIAQQFYASPIHFAPFAAPLKRMIRTLYEGQSASFVEEKMVGGLKEDPCAFLNGHSPRHAMQTLGTEWGRHCMGSNFWVNLWLGRLPEDRKDLVIIADDLRFENEAKTIRDLGGTVIEVVRHSVAPIGNSGHASEFGVAADTVILNNGDVSECHRATIACVTKLIEHDVRGTFV